jgi:hypothetical protein
MKWCLSALLLLGAAAWSQSKGARTFDLPLPENWKDSQHLILVFKDLEVPEDRGVVFRLYPAGQNGGDSLGSVAVLAKSPKAKGTQQIRRLEVSLSGEFRRWAQRAPGERVSVVVKPYAGLREANDYVWKVGELKLEAR